MNLVRSLLTFLVYSNFWIGLGAVLFTWEFYVIYELPVNYAVLIFVFFATVLTYTFQRSVKLSNNSRQGSARISWMLRNDKLVKAILLISLAGSICCLFYFSFAAILLLVGCGFLSLFYIVKLPGKLGKNLRDIPSLKIFLIAIVWTCTSTLLPFFCLESPLFELSWLLLFANFIFIMALTIPFDIRDLILDEPDKKTIPQLVGENGSIWIAMLLLVVYGLILNEIIGHFLFASMIGILCALVFVYRSKKETEDLYFSVVIDGVLLLLPVLLWLDLLPNFI